MKTLEFIYQDTQIHFSVNPLDKDVMINATEMAKAFNKRIDVFLKTKPTQAFIKALEFTPTGGNSKGIPFDKIIKTNHHSGTYFNRILALKFAGWLDPNFEVWVFQTIDKIKFGYYDEHLKATSLLEKEKIHFKKLVKEVGKTQNELAIKVLESLEKQRKYKQFKNTALRGQTIVIQNSLFDSSERAE